jgi:4-azaleucine resistance transporter AzlC
MLSTGAAAWRRLPGPMLNMEAGADERQTGARRVPTPVNGGQSRGEFATGVRLGVGPGAATFVLGLSYGAAASIAGWGVAVPLVFSVLAFSGSAQFTLLTTLAAGSVVAAVTAAILINVRYLMMSVALNDSLRGGRLWRAVQAQALADASFVVAHRGGGQFNVARLVGASVPQWAGWVTGTAVGLLAAPSAQLLHALGADVVFPAFFLMLALDELRRSRRAVVAAALGASIAATLLFVTSPGNALLGATIAALIGSIHGSSLRSNRGGES